MKKFALLLALFILVTGAVATMIAFSTATVVSPAVIKIVSTDDALLALEPGGPAYSDYCFIDAGGTLQINFAGKGFPPESQFEWDELFRVINNSAGEVSFSIENVDERIKYISIRPYGCGDFFINHAANTGYDYPLAPGNGVAITVSFDIPPGVSEEINGILRIRATAAP